MKPIFCLVAAAFAAGIAGSVCAQPPSLPMKMGLWEISVSVRNGPAGKEQTFPTQVNQFCISPQTWHEFLTTQKTLKNQGCQLLHMKEQGKTMTFDVTCRKEPGNMQSSTANTHVVFDFLNPQKMRRRVHSEYLDDANKPMIMETMSDSIYKGTDCKGIVPGKFKNSGH